KLLPSQALKEADLLFTFSRQMSRDFDKIHFFFIAGIFMKTFKDKLIVITGGAGFIGSGIVRYLNDQGIDNLIIVDHLGTTEKWKNLVGKKFVDVIDKTQFFAWLKGRESEIKAFIHLGACSSTVETNANYLLENNYRFSTQLAEYALKHGQRL